jgi:hypothetical protein
MPRGVQGLQPYSWRLLLIDLAIMLYLLCLFIASLVLGIDVTPVVVTNAIARYSPIHRGREHLTLKVTSHDRSISLFRLVYLPMYMVN